MKSIDLQYLKVIESHFALCHAYRITGAVTFAAFSIDSDEEVAFVRSLKFESLEDTDTKALCDLAIVHLGVRIPSHEEIFGSAN